VRPLQRRNYLKAVGGIAGAATIGGIGALVGSSGASATAVQNLGDVSVTSDDGTVEYVAIYGDSTVRWDGFDSTATSFIEVIEARIPGQVGWTTLHDTGEVDLSQGDDWGGPGESLSGPGTSGYIEADIGLRSNGNHNPETDWHIVGTDPDGYGLPANSIDPAALEVDGDGDTGSFTIEIRSKFTWYDDQNDAIFEKSFTTTVGVTVTNEPSSASAENDGGEDGAVAA
jgi:hypothetical protein